MNERTPHPNTLPTLGDAAKRGNERRCQATVVMSMYVGYAYFMVLRSAPGAVVAAIRTDTGVTTEEWGRVLAMSTAGAVIGKLIGGYSADKLGGGITFAIGLLGCSLGLVAFGLSASLGLFQFTFFLALLAKSFGWPAMTRIVGQSFDPPEYGRVWGLLSTSSRAGAIIATLVLGGLIAVTSWRGVLVVAGALGILVAAVFAVVQKFASGRLTAIRSSRHTDDGSDVALSEADDPDHPLHNTSLPTALLRFAMSRQFWLITISLTGMTIMWDFLQLLPLFLQDTLQLSDSNAAMVSSAFPWGSLISVFAGGFLFDSMSRRTMAWIMGGLLMLATACIGTFYGMQFRAPPEGTAVAISVGLLFLYGVAIAPCYYIPMSIFSIRFGGPHAGFLVALLDAVAFGFNAVFQWFGGTVADTSWSNFLILLGVIAFVSAITMFAFMLGEARQYDRSHDSV
jgi:OPA family sugar phosphate sensor protein UhpC-like MFS transporter